MRNRSHSDGGPQFGSARSSKSEWGQNSNYRKVKMERRRMQVTELLDLLEEKERDVKTAAELGKSLIAKIRKLQEKNLDLTQHKVDLEDKLANEKYKLADALEGKAEGETSSPAKAPDTSESEYTILRNQLKGQKEINLMFSNDIERLEEELEESKQRVREGTMHKEKYNALIKEFETYRRENKEQVVGDDSGSKLQVGHLKDAMSKKQIELSGALAEIRALEQDLAEMRKGKVKITNLDAELKKLSMENEDLRDKIRDMGDLEANILSLSKANQMMFEQQKEATTHLTDLRARYNELKDSYIEVNGERERLSHVVGVLKVKLEDVHKERQMESAAVHDLKRQLKEAMDALQSANDARNKEVYSALEQMTVTSLQLQDAPPSPLNTSFMPRDVRVPVAITAEAESTPPDTTEQASEDIEFVNPLVTARNYSVSEGQPVGVECEIQTDPITEKPTYDPEIIEKALDLHQRLNNTAFEKINPMHKISNPLDLIIVSNALIEDIFNETTMFLNEVRLGRQALDPVVVMLTMVTDCARLRCRLNDYAEGIMSQPMDKLALFEKYEKGRERKKAHAQPTTPSKKGKRGECTPGKLDRGACAPASMGKAGRPAIFSSPGRSKPFE